MKTPSNETGNRVIEVVRLSLMMEMTSLESGRNSLTASQLSLDN